MAGQSLTSLKDVPVETHTNGISVEKVEPLVQLQSDIELLKKKEVSMQSYIDRLSMSAGETKKRLNKEIGKLEKEKTKLLNEVKRLSASILELNTHQEKTSKGLNKYGDEHIAFLDSISKALSLDIAATSKVLDQRSKEINTELDFLIGASDYYAQYANNVEATSSQNALERTQLDKKVHILKKQEALSKVNTIATKELLKDAQNKNKMANAKFKKADELAKKMQFGFNEEEERIKFNATTLNYKDKTNKADKQELDKKEKRLKEGLRLVKDKNNALDRKAKELGIVV